MARGDSGSTRHGRTRVYVGVKNGRVVPKKGADRDLFRQACENLGIDPRNPTPDAATAGARIGTEIARLLGRPLG